MADFFFFVIIKKKMHNTLLYKMSLFIISIILLIFGLINISISPPPASIDDIPNQYGKTYCIPITHMSDITREQYEKTTKSQIMNAYILVILVIFFSTVLLIASSASLYDHFSSAKRSVVRGVYLK